ncbi:Myotubularin [Phytophthora megakarya]|uniref:Myotubularin n=1 Tax=Phytophthora megakarya TaxID=4795 RepID=A0A225UR08_9STRA|nr:Myotubularin [Phytophthora megakarya]
MDSENQAQPGAALECAEQSAPTGGLTHAISDFKRNWTDDTVFALVRAWRDVYRTGRAKDEKTTMFNERIFAAYKAAVPSTKRSKKAIEDKLREMYRFICDVNSNHERKELREFNRIKSPNISQQIYSELDSFLSDQPDTTPLAASFPAQPTFPTDDAQPSGDSSVFGDNETDTSADPHNTGQKNNKRKRSDNFQFDSPQQNSPPTFELPKGAFNFVSRAA